MEAVTLTILIAVCGLFIIVIFCFAWSKSDCPSEGGSVNNLQSDNNLAFDEGSQKTRSSSKPDLDKEGKIRNAYDGIAEELFDYVDGKKFKDSWDKIATHIDTFSRLLCQTQDSKNESKVMHMRFIGSIQELIKAQEERPEDSKCKDSEEFTPTGSHTGHESKSIDVAKRNIRNISQELAQSYSNCVNLDVSSLTSFFAATAVHVNAYKRRTSQESRDKIRHQHKALTSRIRFV